MTLGMVLLALTLGLDVLAGGLSLGVKSLERSRWAQTATVFAFLTFLMTTLGVLFGRLLGERLGSHAAYIAGTVLIVVGLRAIADAVIGKGDTGDVAAPESMSLVAILMTGLMVCLDKLAIGVSLAFVESSLTGFIAFLVVQSFVVTLVGLALGKHLGNRIGHTAALVAGAIFALLGLLIIYDTLTGSTII